MLRKVAAGVAGLGLIGGAGTVVYNNNGDATVKIKNKETGQVQTVRLNGADGDSYSCPQGTHDKIEPHDIRLGRIKLTLQQVRREERKIERQYPDHVAPGTVVDRVRALVRRDDRLASAYNAEVDTRNAILEQNCTPE
jgi:hypothetical protein